MVFTSLPFLCVFFPLNMFFYFNAKDIQSKNTVLLIFSLIFYSWGEPSYLFLLLGMAFADWALSLLIQKYKQTALAKVFLFSACAVNLTILGIFKYLTLFLSTSKALFGAPDIVMQIALPIGISFYTFQLLTYVVDVYRGEVKAQPHFSRLLLYVSLFHQCIAGPIVRYQDVQNEIMLRRENFEDITKGINRFVIGLGKKVLIANVCGSIADSMLLSDGSMADLSKLTQNLESLSSRSVVGLWFGMLMFMLQIYLDFSAYSDMAIGMGLMTGFHYKENFNYPYTSKSVTEFWRKWHISLGSFFRDYVYIPMGGNRCSKGRNIFNLFIVWLLTGFWHGASWNFVLWGLYFFLFLLLEKHILKQKLEALPSFVSHLYLLLVVFFGWVLFKFKDVNFLWVTLKGMFGLNGNNFTNFETNTTIINYIFFLVVAIIATTPLIKNIYHFISYKLKYQKFAVAFTYIADIVLPVAVVVISIIMLISSSYNPFLYYQF